MVGTAAVAIFPTRACNDADIKVGEELFATRAPTQEEANAMLLDEVCIPESSPTAIGHSFKCKISGLYLFITSFSPC